jgi:flavodoxin
MTGKSVLPMKSILIIFSYHHNNTEKIAKVFAKVLDAQIKTPQRAPTRTREISAL